MIKFKPDLFVISDDMGYIGGTGEWTIHKELVWQLEERELQEWLQNSGMTHCRVVSTNAINHYFSLVATKNYRHSRGFFGYASLGAL